MDSWIVGRIEEWDSRPFSGGYAGIHDLAEAEFSGALSAGGSWLLLLNGKVVGVPDGSIEDFEGAGGTAYQAPHPALPLLFAMRERGGETRARYFTDETPLEEVDETLSSGSFTGYVELSENVHSGDYYVVYYGGRSMSVAFVGGTGRLVTDEEAFESASDEVGIYEVHDVEIEVHDVPEPEAEGATGGAAGAAPAPDDPSGDAPPGDGDEDAGAPADGEGAESPAETERPDRAGDGPRTGGAETASEGAERTEAGVERTEAGVERTEASESSPPGGEPSTATDETRRTEEPASAGSDADSAGSEASETDDRASEAAEIDSRTSKTTDTDSRSGRDAEARGNATSGTTESGEVGGNEPSEESRFTEEQEWRQAKTVPALDPEESERVDPDRGDRPEGTSQGSERESREPTPRPAPPADRVAELEAEIEDLRERIESLEAERDRLREERDDLEEERDRLEERVEEREREVEELRARESSAGAGEGDDGRRSLAREEALSRTDLLIRYGSQGAPTLEDVREGASAEEVNANLQLNPHTRFDADEVVVEGEPYRSFVTGTLEYRVVEWIVRELPFEIRETGGEAALRDLYEALPAIGRAEFDAAVTTRDEEGEERRETFDVVLRDRKGRPIVVASLNDDRDPATGEMVSDLIESATVVVEGHDSLSAGLAVTASFFEPAAHDVTEEATGGGFLDRDSRKSFVKTSRKRGYHLCLVEAHGEAFRLAVPDL